MTNVSQRIRPPETVLWPYVMSNVVFIWLTCHVGLQIATAKNGQAFKNWTLEEELYEDKNAGDKGPAKVTMDVRWVPYDFAF